ncbi:hypothetical protein GGR21_003505 [Dysgonomonas hofstadii]|uniref:Uncharacterized protein n=1 Tax=Dysgonomonas hofstadii TaxID=637886 RepID=A0A840CXU7_9BACT|nr:hypothetical protein [Dysgonomonas hofstadii]MBB4037585.1 hypothetical protein [Dysgonomonas hofstadii]
MMKTIVGLFISLIITCSFILPDNDLQKPACYKIRSIEVYKDLEPNGKHTDSITFESGERVMYTLSHTDIVGYGYKIEAELEGSYDIFFIFSYSKQNHVESDSPDKIKVGEKYLLSLYPAMVDNDERRGIQRFSYCGNIFPFGKKSGDSKINICHAKNLVGLHLMGHNNKN